MNYKGFKIVKINFYYQIFNRTGRPILPRASTVKAAHKIIDDRISGNTSIAATETAPSNDKLWWQDSDK